MHGIMHNHCHLKCRPVSFGYLQNLLWHFTRIDSELSLIDSQNVHCDFSAVPKFATPGRRLRGPSLDRSAMTDQRAAKFLHCMGGYGRLWRGSEGSLVRVVEYRQDVEHSFGATKLAQRIPKILGPKKLKILEHQLKFFQSSQI